MSRTTLIESYISELATTRDLQACWEGLVSRLAQFGFDRALYGNRADLTEETLRNHANSVILSTYGELLDETFVLGRMYLNSYTVRWSVTNTGAISWSETERAAKAGQLTPQELETYETTQRMGLNAGYTYSFPDRGSGYRSCIGLCFQNGGTQAEADLVWDENGTDIIQLLTLFEIAVNRFAHQPVTEHLPPATLTTLKLLAEGRTVAEIAELQGSHRRTIEDQLARAREQLGAANTLEAVVLAKQEGQI